MLYRVCETQWFPNTCTYRILAGDFSWYIWHINLVFGLSTVNSATCLKKIYKILKELNLEEKNNEIISQMNRPCTKRQDFFHVINMVLVFFILKSLS